MQRRRWNWLYMGAFARLRKKQYGFTFSEKKPAKLHLTRGRMQMGKRAPHIQPKTQHRFANCLLTLLTDAKTLQAIARAVETFQPYPKAIDSLRAGILCLKNILDSKGQTMTVKRLAALLNRKLAGDIPKAPATQDSFSRLRRLAKNLRFPLKKDKTGRPKKGEK